MSGKNPSHELEEDEDRLRDEEFSRKARDRLSGALSSAVDQVEQFQTGVGTANSASELLDGLPDLTVGLDSPLKRIINSSSPWSSPTKSPRSARRRRKKEIVTENAFHHTFVLKLFDRSVDLAQFDQNTSLYPVCRAWMKDQPHNRNFAPRMRTPTPEPQLGKTENDDANGDINEIPPKKRLRQDDEDVYKLPAFEPLINETKPRMPKLEENPKLQSFTLDEIALSENMDLLTSHMEKWQNIRNSWRNAYNQNELRFSDSIAVLKEIFEKN